MAQACKTGHCPGLYVETKTFKKCNVCGEEHPKRIYNKNYKNPNPRMHWTRRPEHHKFYNSKEWKKARNAKISRNPICENCEKNGIVKQAKDVHHIIPVKQGGGNNLENLMSLCKRCHKEIERQ